jgi:hypothetical protein
LLRASSGSCCSIIFHTRAQARELAGQLLVSCLPRRGRGFALLFVERARGRLVDEAP